MTVKEYVGQALESLDERELAKVAEYVSFLRFHSRSEAISALNADELAAIYAESAEDDRRLAEEGMREYAQGLAEEDRK